MEKSFRVVVNLSYFFHDHRSTAIIFISENINKIEDLEQKVSDIFKIDNFYFTCQNRFLPSCEDVRILQKDDLLWVIPKVEEYYVDNVSEVVPVVEEIEEKKSKKRKKKSKEDVIEKVVEENEKVPKKKKKKMEEIAQVYEVDIIEEVVEKKKKKKHKTKNLEPEQKDYFEEDTKNENTKNSSYSSFVNCEPSVEYQCKGDFPYYRKRVTLPTSTEEYLKNKKINIVKIECIRNSQIVSPQINEMEVDQTENIARAKESILEEGISTPCKESEITNNKKDNVNLLTSKPLNIFKGIQTPMLNGTEVFSPKPFLSITKPMETSMSNGAKTLSPKTVESVDLPKNSETNTGEIFDETVTGSEMDYSMISGISQFSNSSGKGLMLSKKCLSGVGTLLESLKSSDFDESLNGEVEEDGNVTKRKRMRKRKKRVDSPMINENTKWPKPKPFVFPGKPISHIKFNEDSESSVITTPVSQEPILNEVKRDDCVSSSYSSTPSTIELVQKAGPVTPATPDDEPIVIEDESMQMTSLDLNEELMLDEEKLLKQPMMVKLMPRKDDVIAFKILMIGENYSPTVSNFIAGKVLNFTAQFKEVEFEILFGLDQFVSRKGKFSIDEEEEEIKKVKKLVWDEVLFPRLLYP